MAAGTATAGHLYVARFASATKAFHVKRLRAFWQTIAGFTAAQEVAIAAYKLTGYSAAHTGGTAAAAPLIVTPGSAVASSLAARMATTAELTAGTHVIADQLMRGCYSELAAGASVMKGFIDEMNIDDETIATLTNQTGILVRNEIAQGAGGTGRLTVELAGYELTL